MSDIKDWWGCCKGGHIWTSWTHQEGRTYTVDAHTDEHRPPPPTNPQTPSVFTPGNTSVFLIQESVCLSLNLCATNFPFSFPLLGSRTQVLRLPSRCVKSFNCLHELRPAGGNPSSESGALSFWKLSSWEKTCELKPYSVYLQLYLHPLQHIKIKQSRIPLIGTQVALRK